MNLRLPYVNAEPIMDSKPWVGTADMFEKPPKPPRARPRVMMHWDDAGHDGNSPMGNFVCKRCGHRAGWLCCDENEMRRGVPCPNCNAEPQSAPIDTVTGNE